MKKRFFILPIMIISVILSCFSFTAFADDEHEHPYTEWSDWDSGNYSSPSHTYVMYMYNNSFYCNIATSNYDTNFYESNGVYTLSYLSNSTYAFDQYGFRYHYYSTSSTNYTSYASWRTLTVDTNNSTIGGINFSGASDCADVPIQYLTLVVNGEVIMYYGERVEESNELDVTVTFNPDLNGSVDRSLFDSSGNIGYLQNLFMTVDNNCSFPIQYRMSIVKANQVSHRGLDSSTSVSYDDDDIFVYYSNNWVYTTPYDNQGDYWSGDYSRQLKPTAYHYVGSGQTDQVKFDFSQINLKEGVEYVCSVTAIRADYDIASEIHTQVGVTEDRLYTELKQVDSLSYETVYSSAFSFLQYSDVHYDPTSSEHGVLPYSGLDDYKRYVMSRLAIDNGDGDIDYTNKNVYDDDSSWYNNQHTYRYDDYTNNGYGSSNSSNSSYSSLLRNTSSVFSFFSSVLGFFPTDVLIVYNIGLWSIIVLLIIRRLH